MNEENESLEARRARLLEQKEQREAVRRARLAAREVERLELAERYEAELGPEGSEFAVFDSGHVDDPLVVVKRPALVQWSKFEQSKQTPIDRYDFVAPSIVHPTKDEWNALREKRPGVELGASNLMAHMMGLKTEADAGK